ncbi:MAG: S46 family peptidase, partial [Bacteroidota bacterium]|nr:S46 family peptidase [Bacteroidota bacterium]
KKKLKNMQNFFKNYDVNIDKKVFASLVPVYLKHVKKEMLSKELTALVNKYPSSEAMVEALYKKSKLHNKEQVEKLLQGSQKSFKKKLEKDPIYNLAQNLLTHFLNEVRPSFSQMTQDEEKLMKSFVKSLMMAYPEKSFWADANSTLRLTYGKVEGSAPRDGMQYTWFTTMDGIIEKYNTGEADFEVPQRLLDLYEEKNYGQYGTDGKLHVCLLGSNHTTGGNSGSPALDAYGRLVGINFDRSWESTMSDVLFDKDICRNIMVDIRYVLWVIDIYAGAGHLVKEMNLVRN